LSRGANTRGPCAGYEFSVAISHGSITLLIDLSRP
jgi:hypothetical protein